MLKKKLAITPGRIRLRRTCGLTLQAIAELDLSKEDDASAHHVPSIGEQQSSVQNPCWLMILGDYTTQHFEDHNNPTGNSL